LPKILRKANIRAMGKVDLNKREEGMMIGVSCQKVWAGSALPERLSVSVEGEGTATVQGGKLQKSLLKGKE